MKLFVDENVSPLVCIELRESGFDVLHAGDCCRGAKDTDIAEILLREKRIIITFDKDFGELFLNFGASTILPRTSRQDPVTVLKVLKDFFGKKADEDISGKMVVITDKKIRIRPE